MKGKQYNDHHLGLECVNLCPYSKSGFLPSGLDSEGCHLSSEARKKKRKKKRDAVCPHA